VRSSRWERQELSLTVRILDCFLPISTKILASALLAWSFRPDYCMSGFSFTSPISSFTLPFTSPAFPAAWPLFIKGTLFTVGQFAAGNCFGTLSSLFGRRR